MFFSKYCEIFKNNYFEEHLQTAASGGIHLPPVPMTVFFLNENRIFQNRPTNYSKIQRFLLLPTNYLRVFDCFLVLALKDVCTYIFGKAWDVFFTIVWVYSSINIFWPKKFVKGILSQFLYIKFLQRFSINSSCQKKIIHSFSFRYLK